MYCVKVALAAAPALLSLMRHGLPCPWSAAAVDRCENTRHALLLLMLLMLLLFAGVVLSMSSFAR